MQNLAIKMKLTVTEITEINMDAILKSQAFPIIISILIKNTIEQVQVVRCSKWRVIDTLTW